jgi:tryptophan-specific transport protein
MVNATLMPALCVRASRKKYDNNEFRVWGGNKLINVIMIYTAFLAICFVLAALGVLPRFG